MVITVLEYLEQTTANRFSALPYIFQYGENERGYLLLIYF